MDEFDLIRKYFAPIAKSRGAEGLANDVAELTVNGRMVATADTIVEGVHFLRDDPIETIAAKLVRVNVSDLLCKGARPADALLSLVWPKSRSSDGVEVFAASLGANLAEWGCSLVGGDTTSIEGPLVLSLTMTGTCGKQGPILRSTASIGEDVWVTGCIGESWLGLQVAMNRDLGLTPADHADLLQRYRVPQPPPLNFAEVIASHAKASIDVSDGLFGDAAHIARQSNVQVDIDLTSVPLSSGAARWIACDPTNRLPALISGGDDYQALFTASPHAREALERVAFEMGLRLTRIGETRHGRTARFLSDSGDEMPISDSWRHRIGE